LKIAFIPTIHTLESDDTDYHMALTHLVLKYPEYEDYYSDVDGYVILDNSLIELGGSVDIKTVMEAADKICPHEVVLPDVFLNCDKTLEATEDALRQIDFPSLHLQAVAHGKDINDWKRCWDKLNKIEELDCIAIPKVVTTIFGHRKDAITYALDNNPSNKEIHLLGLWDTILELKSYTPEQKKKIRGIDTSFVMHSVADGMSYERGEFDKPNYKIDLEHEYLYNNKLLEDNKKFVLDILK